MKHSKLFLTGMAALLLSFGLMMTGCDSGGDSDGGDPINAGDYIDIAVETTGDANTAAKYKVTVKQPLEADKKAVFTNVAGDPTDAPVEYIGGTGGTTKAAQAEAIKTALTGATGAKYTAGTVDTSGADPFFLLTANTAGAIAAAPAVAIDNYEAPAASDQTTTITAAEDDTALVVIATGGTLKTTLYVYLKTTTTPASEITITGTALTGADLTAAGAALGNGVTVTPKTDRFVITGLTAADSTGGVTTLLTGTDKVKVTLKADAQQSGASGVAAHTGVPVVVLEDSAGGYTVVAAASGVGANLAKLHYDSTSKVLKYNETTTNAETTETLDEDFDAALIAVLSNLVPTDTVEFDANGNANAVVFTIAPTAAAKLQAVLDNVGGTTPGVTLGGSTQTTTIAAGSTVTIPAGVTVTVDAANILSVAGTLAFTDNTSVLALIGADGELKATADTAKFHANATTTTGAGLSLTVTAAADLTTATGWSSDNPGTGVSVTVTTGTAASGSGAAYVLGNASLAIKNVTTGAIHAVIPEVSTAAGTATEGGIKAGASSAVVITGKASA